MIDIDKPSFFVAVFWYGGLGAISLLVIYSIFWLKRLMDITKRQLFIALLVSIVLAVLLSIDKYLQFVAQPIQSPLYSDLFEIYLLIVSSFGIICLLYFFVLGKTNLMKNYNININGLWPREIKKMKQAGK